MLFIYNDKYLRPVVSGLSNDCILDIIQFGSAYEDMSRKYQIC